MLTTGEEITNLLKYHLSPGSTSVEYDAKLRAEAAYWLQQGIEKAWTKAPFWFRNTDGTVSIGAGLGVGTMPSDFPSYMGTMAQVYIQGVSDRGPLSYAAPDVIRGFLKTNTVQGLYPTHWTLDGYTALGLAKILIFPTNSGAITLEIKGYPRLCPDLIDRPPALTVAAGSSGLLNGVYAGWRVSFTSANGDTEMGPASLGLTVSSKAVTLTDVPVSPCRAVTGRKVWRPAAAGTTYKLAVTISDNSSTSSSDNTADASLGTTGPEVATAVTGLEQIPSEFQRVLGEYVIAKMMRGGGDLRAKKTEEDWDADMVRMWGVVKPQNIINLMPRFGQGTRIGGRTWRQRLAGR